MLFVFSGYALGYVTGQAKLNSGWNFLTLGWLSIPLSPSPNYSWITARKQDLLRINLHLATKLLLLICYSNRLNFREQKNPHPSPLPFIQLFSIGSSNSGTMLHGGMGEEKLYFPLWKSVKHQKTPYGEVSTNFAAVCTWKYFHLNIILTCNSYTNLL